MVLEFKSQVTSELLLERVVGVNSASDLKERIAGEKFHGTAW